MKRTKTVSISQTKRNVEQMRRLVLDCPPGADDLNFADVIATYRALAQINHTPGPNKEKKTVPTTVADLLVATMEFHLYSSDIVAIVLSYGIAGGNVVRDMFGGLLFGRLFDVKLYISGSLTRRHVWTEDQFNEFKEISHVSLECDVSQHHYGELADVMSLLSGDDKQTTEWQQISNTAQAVFNNLCENRTIREKSTYPRPLIDSDRGRSQRNRNYEQQYTAIAPFLFEPTEFQETHSVALPLSYGWTSSQLHLRPASLKSTPRFVAENVYHQEKMSEVVMAGYDVPNRRYIDQSNTKSLVGLLHEIKNQIEPWMLWHRLLVLASLPSCS